MRVQTAAAPPVQPESLVARVPLAGVVLCLVIVLSTGPGQAQVPLPAPAETAGAGPAKAASSAGRGAASSPRAVRTPTSPPWSELTPPQQAALAPLATTWPTISEAQKRKWLVISKSYERLPPAEQVKLHSRMSEWVALSPQQRTQARLNFAESKQLSADDKKAKWEEYQALPPEQKRKLAAGAASAAAPPATAAAVKPVSPKKLATVPKGGGAKPSGIVASPNQVDHNTLLPQPVPTPASSN